MTFFTEWNVFHRKGVYPEWFFFLQNEFFFAETNFFCTEWIFFTEWFLFHIIKFFQRG